MSNCKVRFQTAKENVQYDIATINSKYVDSSFYTRRPSNEAIIAGNVKVEQQYKELQERQKEYDEVLREMGIKDSAFTIKKEIYGPDKDAMYQANRQHVVTRLNDKVLEEIDEWRKQEGIYDSMLASSAHINNKKEKARLKDIQDAFKLQEEDDLRSGRKIPEDMEYQTQTDLDIENLNLTPEALDQLYNTRFKKDGMKKEDYAAEIVNFVALAQNFMSREEIVEKIKCI